MCGCEMVFLIYREEHLRICFVSFSGSGPRWDFSWPCLRAVSVTSREEIQVLTTNRKIRFYRETTHGQRIWYNHISVEWGHWDSLVYLVTVLKIHFHFQLLNLIRYASEMLSVSSNKCFYSVPVEVIERYRWDSLVCLLVVLQNVFWFKNFLIIQNTQEERNRCLAINFFHSLPVKVLQCSDT